MSELAQLQTDLLTSMLGMLIVCVVIAGTIAAGYWLLLRQAARRREQVADVDASAEWFNGLKVHLEIGDCRPDCGCEKPCEECE